MSDKISTHYDVVQGSPEWHSLRKILTASKLGFLIYAKSHPEKMLAARQIIGLEEIQFTDEQKANMQIGIEYEDTLRNYYCKKNKYEL